MMRLKILQSEENKPWAREPGIAIYSYLIPKHTILIRPINKSRTCKIKIFKQTRFISKF